MILRNKIGNEKLYNKDANPFHNRDNRPKTHKSERQEFKEVTGIYLELKEFIDRIEKGPNIILPVDKKRRVYEAIDLGLKKYLPKKKKKNFKMQIQMIEKLLHEKESNDYILSLINPPPGINFSNEIMEKKRQEALEIQHQIQLEKELHDKLEQEKKMMEFERQKNSIFKRGPTSKISVEEVGDFTNAIRRQSKINIGDFTSQLKEPIQRKTTKFITDISDSSKIKKEAENYLEERISTFKPKNLENKSILK